MTIQRGAPIMILPKSLHLLPAETAQAFVGTRTHSSGKKIVHIGSILPAKRRQASLATSYPGSGASALLYELDAPHLLWLHQLTPGWIHIPNRKDGKTTHGCRRCYEGAVSYAESCTCPYCEPEQYTTCACAVCQKTYFAEFVIFEIEFRDGALWRRAYRLGNVNSQGHICWAGLHPNNTRQANQLFWEKIFNYAYIPAVGYGYSNYVNFVKEYSTLNPDPWTLFDLDTYETVLLGEREQAVHLTMSDDLKKVTASWATRQLQGWSLQERLEEILVPDQDYIHPTTSATAYIPGF